MDARIMGLALLLAQAPTPDSVGGWMQYATAGGALSLALLFLWGFKVQWWVTGSLYETRVAEVRECRVEVTKIAMRLADAEKEHAARAGQKDKDHIAELDRQREAYQAALAARDSALERLNESVRQQVVPTLTRVTDALARIAWLEGPRPPTGGG